MASGDKVTEIRASLWLYGAAQTDPTRSALRQHRANRYGGERRAFAIEMPSIGESLGHLAQRQWLAVGSPPLQFPLTEAKHIFSQLGQAPVLARVHAALAELGK
jgi:hypothetical protein